MLETLKIKDKKDIYLWCAGSYFQGTYTVSAAVNATKDRPFLETMYKHYRSGFMLAVGIDSDEDLDILKANDIQCGPEFYKDEKRIVICFFNYSRDYVVSLDDIEKDTPNANSRWV